MPPPVDAALIDRAVAILRRGGLVAVPTETVYGLAADASNPAAVRAIFAAKGRPADHPVIVHLADAAALDGWARDVPDAARRLAAAYWPGPLTLVLKRAVHVDDVITGGQDTIGLRAPAHPWTRALLQAFGGALAAPSANRFGRISPTTAEHVRADLGEKPRGVVDLILDGGPCPIGIESTIVDLSGATPQLLRPGAVTRAALERILKVAVADAGDAAPRASGRLESHYAPVTPLEVVPAAMLAARVAQLSDRRLAILAPPDRRAGSRCRGPGPLCARAIRPSAYAGCKRGRPAVGRIAAGGARVGGNRRPAASRTGQRRTPAKRPSASMMVARPESIELQGARP
jgi:L-threonylcarbamoyladenylate synthase